MNVYISWLPGSFLEQPQFNLSGLKDLDIHYTGWLDRIVWQLSWQPYLHPVWPILADVNSIKITATEE